MARLGFDSGALTKISDGVTRVQLLGEKAESAYNAVQTVGSWVQPLDKYCKF